MYKIIKKRLKSNLLNILTDSDYHFKTKSADHFIISYPKSGNTWMLFLVANLISSKEIYFDNIEEYIIDIYQTNAKKIEDYRNKREKTFFKSHTYFRPKYSPNKVLYIVRDPRDVVLSYYHWYNYRKNEMKLDVFIDKFLLGKLDKFGSWKQNAGSWMGARKGDDNFLLIKYEDMLENTLRELQKVSMFFGLKTADKNLENAIRSSDFTKLQNKQMSNRKMDQRKLFFRKGTSKQWKNELSDHQVERINQHFGSVMLELGYI